MVLLVYARILFFLLLDLKKHEKNFKLLQILEMMMMKMILVTFQAEKAEMNFLLLILEMVNSVAN